MTSDHSLTQLEQQNQRLQDAVRELSVLNDIATSISSTQSLERVIDEIVERCISHLDAEEGTVSLLEKPESGEEEFQTMIRRQDRTRERVPYRLDSHLTGWMLKHRSPLLSNDLANDERFNKLDNGRPSFDSLLCAPLICRGKLIGYLAVFNKKEGISFTDDDRKLLSIIATQAAQMIENARLYEEEKNLIGLREEMRLAREIQAKLLPKQNPEIDGYQLCGINIPAHEVGGDYYDFIPISDHLTGLCIGDITGKGMPAALLMASLQASILSLSSTTDDCCKCLRSVNRLLYRNTTSEKFATFFLGMLNTAEHRLTYANGGHDAPLLFRDDSGEPVPLEATGLLLGIMEETEYSSHTISINPGDLLISYTDGITEAMNEQGEEFGIDRLIDLVQAQRKEPASAVRDAILREVKAHASGTDQSDDITLLLVKRNS